MTKSIQHKLVFKQAPAEVWEYLTKADLLELWLMKNDFQPIVGHQFNFRSGPLPQFDFDGIFYGTVLEIIPFKKLTYALKGGTGGGRISLDSVVEWTLHPTAEGTELQLVHSGFKELENFMIFAAMNDGWFKNMHKIAELLNSK